MAKTLVAVRSNGSSVESEVGLTPFAPLGKEKKKVPAMKDQMAAMEVESRQMSEGFQKIHIPAKSKP